MNKVVRCARGADGGVVAMESSSEASGEPVAGYGEGGSVDVFVTVDEALWDAPGCLASVCAARSEGWPGVVRIIAVDCTPDGSAAGVLEDLRRAGLADEALAIPGAPGRMGAFSKLLESSRADWAVHLDNRVAVAASFLRTLLGAPGLAGAGMVAPWSTKRVLIPPGAGWRGLADAAAAGAVETVPAALPCGSCFAVRPAAARKVGGEPRLGFGEGWSQDLAMRMRQAGLGVARATGCLVHDRTPGPAGYGEFFERKAGLERFASIWGDKASTVEAEAARDLPRFATELKAAPPKVVFVFHEGAMCGAMLAVAHICNRLADRGIPATFACLGLPKKDAAIIPMDFAPIVCASRDHLFKTLAKELPRGAHAIATIWATVAYVQEVARLRPDVVPGYFVQDDERRFLLPNGIPYAKAASIEESYAAFDRVVVNSRWVLDEIRGHLKSPGEAALIGIGVDPLMFRPSGPRADLPTVMAHCRPSTPRRGWPFIARVLERVAAVNQRAQFVIYDEAPEGLGSWAAERVRCLGKLSPAGVAEAMRRAHVFIEGSTLQGWGMQALEAMASGCALVSTANRGIDNYGTQGRDCVVVPHGDVERAAAVVCRLLDNEPERAKLAAAAVRTAARFDWQAVVDGWEEWLGL
jgi:glycosyltransferase involved in cell wall biosynthesis